MDTTNLTRTEHYYLNWLRVTLAYIGIVYHSWVVSIPGFYNPSLYLPTDTIFEFLLWCSHSFRMQVFFMISGFLFFSHQFMNRRTFGKSLLKTVGYFVLIYFIFTPLVLSIFKILRSTDPLVLDDFIFSIWKNLFKAFRFSLRFSYSWFMFYLLVYHFFGNIFCFLIQKFSKPHLPKFDDLNHFVIIFLVVLFFLFLLFLNSHNLYWNDLGRPFNQTPTKMDMVTLFYYGSFFVTGIFLNVIIEFFRKFRSFVLYQLTFIIALYSAIYFFATMKENYSDTRIVLVTLASTLTPIFLIGTFSLFFSIKNRVVQMKAKNLVWIYILHYPIILAIRVFLKQVGFSPQFQSATAALATISLFLLQPVVLKIRKGF